MTAAFSSDSDNAVGTGDLNIDQQPWDDGDAGSTASWLDSFTDGEADPDDSSSLALFEGDTGGLTIAQRKALVALLKNRFITAARHSTEWRVLLESEELLRSRLNDLFLDLHLDRHRQVAFKRQAVPEGGGRFPTLLHDVAWGREETILLIFLRTRFRSDRSDGADEVIVDRDEMLETVAAFRPAHATDASGDHRKTDNAIDSLKRTGILVKTTDEHRLLVSPVIEVLLPLEKLHQLLDWFHTHNDPDTEPAGSDDLTLLPDSGAGYDTPDERTETTR